MWAAPRVSAWARARRPRSSARWTVTHHHSTSSKSHSFYVKSHNNTSCYGNTSVVLLLLISILSTINYLCTLAHFLFPCPYQELPRLPWVPLNVLLLVSHARWGQVPKIKVFNFFVQFVHIGTESPPICFVLSTIYAINPSCLILGSPYTWYDDIICCFLTFDPFSVEYINKSSQ